MIQPIKDKEEAVIEITCMVARVERIDEGLLKYLLAPTEA